MTQKYILTCSETKRVGNSMKVYQLTLITQQQSSRVEAEVLAIKLRGLLNCRPKIPITKNQKEEQSFKIVLTKEIQDPVNSILECLYDSDKIATPWIVELDQAAGEIELLFRQTKKSRFNHLEFKVIKWAHLEIVDS